MLASAAVVNLAGKVVFLDRFQHGGLRLRVELSASLSPECVVFATAIENHSQACHSGGNPMSWSSF